MIKYLTENTSRFRFALCECSNKKSISVVNVNTPVKDETPKKNTNMKCHLNHEVCLRNDYVRNEVFDNFYDDYLEFKFYVTGIIKATTPEVVHETFNCQCLSTNENRIT